MDRTPDRWRQLEERVAAHFAAHGYRTELNAVREGRSGGRHEVDVLAEKHDSLTTFRVAVECKAWNAPVDAGVVAKLDHVVRDLGLNKGILVSLAGCHAGARLAAEQHGIDVWGRDEVRHHLGPDAGIGGSDSGAGVGDRGLALAPALDEARGERLVRQAAAGGVLGLGRERVVWSGPAWLPACELRLAFSRTAGRLHRRVAVTRSWNLYETLSGSLVGAAGAPRPFAEVALEGRAVTPLVRETRIAAGVRKAVARFQAVTSPAALDRHAADLAALGVPTPLLSVDVEDARTVLLPFYLGLLERGSQQRLVAVDATTRSTLAAVTAAANAHLRHVEACIGA